MEPFLDQAKGQTSTLDGLFVHQNRVQTIVLEDQEADTSGVQATHPHYPLILLVITRLTFIGLIYTR